MQRLLTSIACSHVAVECSNNKFSMCVYIYKHFVCVFVKGRVTHRRRERERQVPSADSLPKMPQQLDLRLKPGASNLLWFSHIGTKSKGLEPSSTAFAHNKPHTITSELEWEWNSQKLIWCPYLMPRLLHHGNMSNDYKPLKLLIF